jgi:hypothetical protein
MKLLSKAALLAALISLFAVQPALSGGIEGHVLGAGPKADLSNFVISVEESAVPFQPQQSGRDGQKSRFPPCPGGSGRDHSGIPKQRSLARVSISPTKRFNLGLYAGGITRRLRFDNRAWWSCSPSPPGNVRLRRGGGPHLRKPAPTAPTTLTAYPQAGIGCFWHERYLAQNAPSGADRFRDNSFPSELIKFLEKEDAPARLTPDGCLPGDRK